MSRDHFRQERPRVCGRFRRRKEHGRKGKALYSQYSYLRYIILSRSAPATGERNTGIWRYPDEKR